MAKSLAPIGCIFSLITIVTGSFWGKPTWGTWWVWDARLTSMLVLFLFYIAYILAWKLIADYERASKISSIIGISGNSGQINYAASKAGIIALTKSLSKEVGSRNITVNAIAPGYIKTKMTNTLDNNKQNSFLDNIPLRRFGNTTDVANLVCFLSSDLASYITGETISIDGGLNK